MRNILLLISYDGNGYSGFQVQENGVTVQGILQEAISEITCEESRVIPSGRTDAGVHATLQAVHFHTGKRISARNILKGVNGKLPATIRIMDAREVPSDFHARRDVTRKWYTYLLFNDSVLPPFFKGYAWHIPHPILDLKQLQALAPSFKGRRDYKAFMGSGSSVTRTVRELDLLEVTRVNDFVVITFSGKGFLKNMVRNITGTLVDAALGKISGEEIDDIFRSKDRRRAGRCAPGEGLYLSGVEYGKEVYKRPLPFFLDL